MLVIRAGIHKLLVRIANTEDPDQTASLEAVCSGSCLFVELPFCQANSVENFKHLLYCMKFKKRKPHVYVY